MYMHGTKKSTSAIDPQLPTILLLFYYFETGFHFIVLAVLELTL